MTGARPPVRYATSGDVSIAYRVMGEGPLDLVWVHGLAGNLEADWESPFLVQLFERLASFSRLISFDKRGVGLSDRNVGAPTLEGRMDDVRAVMDAVGSERAALLGLSEGGPMCILFAATYPERTLALVLYGTLARVRRDVDYPYGNEEAFDTLYRIADQGWGTGESLSVFAPSLLGDERLREQMGYEERTSGSPGTIRAFLDTLLGIDVRPVLPTISVPTLVLHGRDDITVPIGNGRWLSDHIEGARFVELPGEHLSFAYEPRFSDEIEEFLTGDRRAPDLDRMLSTILFTDIVASTERAAAMGDRQWRDLLELHHSAVRHELARFRGREVDTAGDGFFATFDGPARAIRCAMSICRHVHELGIEVRAGVHTGEVEVTDQGVAGIAVHIGARISALAQPSEVLVSRTVVDLVAGSNIQFEDREIHRLKGVPGEWQLFAAHE